MMKGGVLSSSQVLPAFNNRNTNTSQVQTYKQIIKPVNNPVLYARSTYVGYGSL